MDPQSAEGQFIFQEKSSMKIENGVIVEATEKELYGVWLKSWSDVFDFKDYLRRIQDSGTKIVG